MISHISLPWTDLPLLLPGGPRLCLLLVSSKSCTEAVKGPCGQRGSLFVKSLGPSGLRFSRIWEQVRSWNQIGFFFSTYFGSLFLRFSKRSEREKVLLPISQLMEPPLSEEAQTWQTFPTADIPKWPSAGQECESWPTHFSLSFPRHLFEVTGSGDRAARWRGRLPVKDL